MHSRNYNKWFPFLQTGRVSLQESFCQCLTSWFAGMISCIRGVRAHCKSLQGISRVRAPSDSDAACLPAEDLKLTCKRNERALLVESGTPWLDLQHLFLAALAPECSAGDVFALWVSLSETSLDMSLHFHFLPGACSGSFYTDIVNADFSLVSRLVFGTPACPQNSSPQKEPSNK